MRSIIGCICSMQCPAGSPARLQGELAVSRAIGDFSYRQFGLASNPELRWHNISAVDRWLLLASDGIFESLSAETVCHIAAGTQEGEHHLSCCHNLISSRSWGYRFCELLHFVTVSNVAQLTMLAGTQQRSLCPQSIASCEHSCGCDLEQVTCHAGRHVSTVAMAAIPLMPVHGQEYISAAQETGSNSASDAASSEGTHDVCYDQGHASCLHGTQAEQQAHSPDTLQQAIASSIQQAAFDAGSSDNLAVVVLDINPGSSDSIKAQDLAQADASVKSPCRANGPCPQQECKLLLAQQQQQQQQQPDSVADPIYGTESVFSSYAKQTGSTHLIDQNGHALPAEHFDFQTPSLSSFPGVTLWQDNSQIVPGMFVGHATEFGRYQYRLLDQVAQLPRYADHVHTSWAGLPILSSMSLWLQPHWPNSATSNHLATGYKDQADYPGASALNPEEFDQRPYVQSSTSQLMLSPGSMLQLVQRQTHTSQSCLWNQDSRACLDEDSMVSDAPLDSTDWLSSTASAVGQAVSAMPTHTPTVHGEVDSPAWFWPTDSLHLEGLIDANTSDLQPVHARAPELQSEWQKYERGRNFARGSFGEVWRAEQAIGGSSADPS